MPFHLEGRRESPVEHHQTGDHLWMKSIGEDVARILVDQLGPVPKAEESLPPIPKLPIDPIDVKYFIDGQIEVLVRRDHFKEIDRCFKDTTQIESQLSEAIESFMKKDVTDILNGVKIFGEILEELPTQLDHCQGMEDDMKRIEAWADIFKHPFTLIPKVISNTEANFPDILHNINKIVQIATKKSIDHV